MIDPMSYERNPGVTWKISKYRANNYQHDIDMKKTISNFERINNRLKKENKTYWDFYYENYWEKLPLEVSEFNKLIQYQRYKIFASGIEVLRQSGEKNWKLYSRWGGYNGIGDLSSFYENKFKKSNRKNYVNATEFAEWLMKKRILDKSHFKKISNSKYLKYGSMAWLFRTRDNISRICSVYK